MKGALVIAMVIAIQVPALAASPATFPDCQGYKVPPELKGKKAIEKTFIGPSGGALIIVHIGGKILCDSAEPEVTASERRTAEHQVLTGTAHKHTPTIKDFNVGYAGPDCTTEYQDCYEPDSPNYPSAEACAEYAARCVAHQPDR